LFFYGVKTINSSLFKLLAPRDLRVLSAADHYLVIEKKPLALPISNPSLIHFQPPQAITDSPPISPANPQKIHFGRDGINSPYPKDISSLKNLQTPAHKA
jgi:hypothetical protein